MVSHYRNFRNEPIKIASLLLLVIGLLFIGIPSVLRLVPLRPVRTRTIDTKLLCKEILIGIDLLEQSQKNELLAIVPSDGLSLNRKTANLLVKIGPEWSSLSNKIRDDGLFYDAWGKPLIFCSTNDIFFEQVNPHLKGKSRFLTVWSAGPNGINEFGFGDDIFSEY